MPEMPCKKRIFAYEKEVGCEYAILWRCFVMISDLFLCSKHPVKSILGEWTWLATMLCQLKLHACALYRIFFKACKQGVLQFVQACHILLGKQTAVGIAYILLGHHSMIIVWPYKKLHAYIRCHQYFIHIFLGGDGERWKVKGGRWKVKGERWKVKGERRRGLGLPRVSRDSRDSRHSSYSSYSRHSRHSSSSSLSRTLNKSAATTSTLYKKRRLSSRQPIFR